MNVVFQNDAVVVVDKPPGVLTVPSRLGAEDARPCLGRDLEKALGQRLWPVHRLDLEATGLVLFAKTAEAHRVASQAFEHRRVHKTYEALTEGAERSLTLPAEFQWRSLLVRGKKRTFEAPHGKPARTHARCIGRVPADPIIVPGPGAPVPRELLRWHLHPETGRPHQLRVHLANAGFAIAGDRLYGARTTLRTADAIALRSIGLRLLDESDRLALGLPEVLEARALVE